MSKTLLNPSGIDFVDYRIPIWGDSYNWSWNRKLNEVKYLVIHHTVTPHGATPDDIALLHKVRGWGGVGYHFIITKDGTVYYVGDIGTARANVKDMNEQVIGIALIGDFTKHLPSDKQIISAHKLCQFLIENYPALENITGWDKMLVGHKDLLATACPGSSWGASASDHMKWRIMTGTPYTPQEEEVDWKEKYEELTKTSGSWEETAKSLTTFRQGLAESLGVADDDSKIKIEVKALIKKEDIQEDLKTELNSIFAKAVNVLGIEGFQKAWTESSDEERKMVLEGLDKTSDKITELTKANSTFNTKNEKLKAWKKARLQKERQAFIDRVLVIYGNIKKRVFNLFHVKGGEKNGDSK